MPSSRINTGFFYLYYLLSFFPPFRLTFSPFLPTVCAFYYLKTDECHFLKLSLLKLSLFFLHLSLFQHHFLLFFIIFFHLYRPGILCFSSFSDILLWQSSCLWHLLTCLCALLNVSIHHIFIFHLLISSYYSFVTLSSMISYFFWSSLFFILTFKCLYILVPLYLLFVCTSSELS